MVEAVTVVASSLSSIMTAIIQLISVVAMNK
jgi:hypothetical protein